ncbi:MAG: hypothetical protein J6112_03490 [Clostridia bacterium]|nr:hypothetical protein [Clostridia bacterium]
MKYTIEILSKEHPLYGDFSYDVKKIVNGGYFGEGRFCRDLQDVMRYLSSEERKREISSLQNDSSEL